MRRNFRPFVALLLASMLFSGCLTVEMKQYFFELTGDNSGRLTIRYINIMSIMDDGVDVSDVDYEELINSYLYGNEIEEEFPYGIITSKRLYRDGAKLCGEVIIDFDNLDAVKLHRFDENSPIMFALCQCLNSETYVTSNGRFAGENVPVVVWPHDARQLNLTTIITEPDESTISLLPYYLESE